MSISGILSSSFGPEPAQSALALFTTRIATARQGSHNPAVCRRPSLISPLLQDAFSQPPPLAAHFQLCGSTSPQPVSPPISNS